MTRRCGSCGTPAPDGESRFCTRCGQAIVDEPEPYPVCGACGAMVADPQAQFCDKCGGPIRKAVTCPACGSPAIDENSKFCTRCGTTFAKPDACPACGFPVPDDRAAFCNRCGAPLRSAGPEAAPAVVITKRRSPLPAREETVADWDPWSDGSPEYESPQEQPVHTAPQISIAPKKYSHLPLVADELKGAKNPGETAKKERPARKGVLGFMKR